MATLNPDQPTVTVDETWQRIAGLQLRLRASLTFHIHHYRGEPWLIIADQRDGNYFRCSASVEQFLYLLDGTRSVEQALADAQQQAGQVLSQHDIMLLIANLKSNDLLMEDASEGLSNETRGQADRKKHAVNSWMRPFAIRFALFNPDRFLRETYAITSPCLIQSRQSSGPSL